MPSAPAATRAILATALTGMGALHFTPSGRHGMAAMIPPRMRGRGLLSPQSLVLITGACELAGAGGLLLPATRRAAGTALLAFYTAVFPANAYAAQDPDRFGAIAVPLWPRLGAQVVLGALTAYAAFARR
jgi:uncharacterized membrane protein